MQDNALTAIDITANPNVRWLNIGNNEVSSIDVTKQKNLSIFIAENNNLTEVDLSGNASISSLNLSGNDLTSVDLSKAPYLSQCNLAGNKLSALDLSKNAYLYGLFCGGNMLTSLDISANTYLQRLEAQGNQLTSLDVTNNGGLQELLIQENNMDKDAINAVINALPDVSSVNVTPETEEFIRQLNISDMPGTAGANVATAETKGWFVTAETTAIEDVEASSAEVVNVVYYNVEGMASEKPFDGLNIKVETLSDGSRRISKVMNRF